MAFCAATDPPTFQTPNGSFTGWDRLLQGLNRLFLSTADIDWSRTKAYCLSEFGMLRLNVQGREPQGVVPPQE